METSVVSSTIMVTGDKSSCSVDDKASAGALLPRFQLVHPRRPHGTVVIGPESVAGLVLLPGADEAVRLDKLRLVEGAIVDYPRLEAFEAERLLFARQPLAVGQISAAMLCRSVVAVIGLSGGGSQVFPHLTRAGVGTIIGVDPQRVDADNLHASPWFTRFHSLARCQDDCGSVQRVARQSGDAVPWSAPSRC